MPLKQGSHVIIQIRLSHLLTGQRGFSPPGPSGGTPVMEEMIEASPERRLALFGSISHPNCLHCVVKAAVSIQLKPRRFGHKPNKESC